MKTLRTCTFPSIIFLCILLNSCKHEPILPPGTPDVSFKTDVQVIISSKCTYACHKGNDEGPSLIVYNDVHNLVKDFKPMESKLYKVITAHSSLQNLMPPKPDQPINKSQIDIISIWILQGARDN